MLLSIALSTTLARINDDQLQDYEHIEPDDDRKCQILLNYDRLHNLLEEYIEKLDLPRPALFEKSYIDRHSLTFFNSEIDEVNNID